MSESKPWAIYYKQATENVQDINSSLLKHIEFVENENIKLTNALSESQIDNKEKESSLDDAHKIITKLNDEYNRLMKEFKILENYNDELIEENKDQKRVIFEKVKSTTYYDKIAKINETLKTENEKLKKEIIEFRSNLNYKLNETVVFEKENKENNNTICSLNSKLIEYEELIREKESIIRENENKAEEFRLQIEKKNDHISILNRNLNEVKNEKKNMIDEITKKATNTIKMFYTSINNNNPTASNNQGNSINEDFMMTKNEIITSIKKNKSNDLFNEIATKNISLNLDNYNQFNPSSNLQFQNDILKSELMCNYFCEVNVLKFINEKAKLDVVEDKLGRSHENVILTRLLLRNEEAEMSFLKLKNSYNILKEENLRLFEKICLFEQMFDSIDFDKITESIKIKTKKIDLIPKNNTKNLNKLLNEKDNNAEEIFSIIDKVQANVDRYKKNNVDVIKKFKDENENLKKMINIANKQKTSNSIKPVFNEEIENETDPINLKELILGLKNEREKDKKLNRELNQKLEINNINLSNFTDENELLKNKNVLLENEHEKVKKTMKNYAFENEKLMLFNKNIQSDLEKFQNELLSLKNLQTEGNLNNNNKRSQIEHSTNDDNLKQHINVLNNEINNLKITNSNLTKQNNILVENLKNQINQLNSEFENFRKKKKLNLFHENCYQFSYIQSNQLRFNEAQTYEDQKEQNDKIHELTKENDDIREKYEILYKEYSNFLNTNNLNQLNSNRSIILNESVIDFNQLREENAILKENTLKYEEIITNLNKKLDEVNQQKSANQYNSRTNDKKPTIRKFKKLQFILGDAFSFLSKQTITLSQKNSRNPKISHHPFTLERPTISCNFCNHIYPEIFMEFKNILNVNILNELKNFYDNFCLEMEKLSMKINETLKLISESEIMNDNFEKRIKVKEVREIMTSTHKFIMLIGLGLTKNNSEFQSNLKYLKNIIFFSQKILNSSVNTQTHDSNILSSFNKTMNVAQTSYNPLLNKINYTLNNSKNQNIQGNSFISILNDFSKCFNQNELKMIYANYEHKGLIEIIKIFKSNCDTIKTNVLETKCDNEILENNDYNNRRPINKRLSEVYLNDSYNIVNEKIIKLKKLEFVFSNLTEILKHYAVVQDIIAKSLLDNSLAQNDKNYSFESSKFESFKGKIELFDKLFFILEETFFFKSNELDEDSIVIRKVVLRLIRNTKFILPFSSELY